MFPRAKQPWITKRRPRKGQLQRQATAPGLTQLTLATHRRASGRGAVIATAGTGNPETAQGQPPET
eukprot:5960310-Lingulodinium_polyedra.AAC.1